MLMRFDPFREIDRVAHQIDQAFRQTSLAIPMDAVRSGDQVRIYFDLPGVDPDAIDLTVERDVLTVSASRHRERGEDEEVLANERPQGTFTRRVLMGENVDTSRLDAAYEDGVLTVTIPVTDAAKPRRIPIGHGGRSGAIEASASESGSGD